MMNQVKVVGVSNQKGTNGHVFFIDDMNGNLFEACQKSVESGANHLIRTGAYHNYLFFGVKLYMFIYNLAKLIFKFPDNIWVEFTLPKDTDAITVTVCDASNPDEVKVHRTQKWVFVESLDNALKNKIYVYEGDSTKPRKLEIDSWYGEVYHVLCGDYFHIEAIEYYFENLTNIRLQRNVWENLQLYGRFWYES